ncbi:b(0,+)-type amino acid transporter 1-like [Amphiura filiformis]|uniref:b(0,+)-type amino acid transporter 1-like n=1 Tax=Amphiura filiformis TaxID=82378 RepID=UPI003B223CB3
MDALQKRCVNQDLPNQTYKNDSKALRDVGMDNKVDASAENGTVKLKRQVGLLSGTAFIVGCMIGSGIFISPKGILRQTNSVGMSLVVWALCGVVATFGALCFAELGTIIPKSGAQYAYLHAAFGGPVAYMYAWSAITVTKPSSLAIIILACADYAVQPFYEGTDCEPPRMAVKFVAACGIILIMSLNCISARLASIVINFFTVAKILALIIIIIAGVIEMAKGNTEYIDPRVSFEGSTTNILAYAIAFYQGLWAYDGWNQLNFVTEELKNPMKNLPLAIIMGVPFVTIIYILTNLAYFTVMSPAELLQSNAVAVTFASRTLGPVAWIIPLAVVMSTFGAATVSGYTSGRIPYVAAREGHMINILSMAHVRQHTPVPSTLIMGTIALILIIPADIDELINYFNFTSWLFYGSSFAALLVLRYKHPEWNRPIKVPLPIPIFMVLASCYFVISPIIDDPQLEFLYAFLFMFAGFIFYIPFVHFKYELPFMDQMTSFFQQFLEVSPSGYNIDDKD